MDVSYPIRTVVPSLDGRVLQALAGSTAPMALTRVHRLAGAGSVSGVRKVLLRLADTGLVDVVPGGYVLNREHVAALPVEQLVGLRREVFRRLLAYVEAVEPRPLFMGVFGSFARGDGDADSDIDVLVVTPAAAPPLAGSAAQEDDFVPGLALAVRRWTGNAAHVVAVTPADLARMRSGSEPILDSWGEDLVVLLGDRRVLRT